MKKIVSVLICVLLAFSFCASVSSAVTVAGATATLAFLKEVALDEVLNFSTSIIDSISDSNSKKIEAARLYYFYVILNDNLSSGKSVFDDSGIKFSDDIYDFYFEEYYNAATNLDVFLSDGDIFMTAAGFNDTPFSIGLLRFAAFNLSSNFGVLKPESLKPAAFSNFKKYYDTMLARYIIEHNEQASDPNPGKSGLEIAPAYVTSDELVEGLERDNKMFFPKSYEAKISYRTDDNYQRYVSSLSNQNNAYCYRPFILDNSLFVGTNDAQKMYFTMFADVDGEKYYSEYQFCVWFDVQEVLDDDGNFQSYKKIINLKVWSALDETEESAKTIYTSKFDFSPYKYMILVNEPSNGFCFYAYKKYSDYLADYPRGSLGTMILDYDKLYSPDFTSFDDYTNFWSNSTTNHRFKGIYDNHDSDCCYGGNCDLGLLVDSKPIEFTWRDIDTSKIGKGQVVTINGDTIYNYTITNPETGDSSKFGDYITNNYTYITNNNGGSSGGTVGGDVTVGGKIDVGGSVAVDVNVNVNGAGGSGNVNPSDFTSADNVDLTKYYDNAVEQSTGFQKFLKDFFGFLPAELLGLILFAVAMAIVCRVFGR